MLIPLLGELLTNVAAKAGEGGSQTFLVKTAGLCEMHIPNLEILGSVGCI